MKKMIAFAGMAMLFLSSCVNDDNDYPEYMQPTAVVTVYPQTDGAFVMNLDMNTTLIPDNLAKSPFGDKTVRALVNYSEIAQDEPEGEFRSVHVNVHRIDSIRTKLPVADAGAENSKLYGNDPLLKLYAIGSRWPRTDS